MQPILQSPKNGTRFGVRREVTDQLPGFQSGNAETIRPMRQQQAFQFCLSLAVPLAGRFQEGTNTIRKTGRGRDGWDRQEQGFPSLPHQNNPDSQPPDEGDTQTGEITADGPARKNSSGRERAIVILRKQRGHGNLY